jgi:tripartite-type tricarboxylate transporter receptor subunit TctC
MPLSRRIAAIFLGFLAPYVAAESPVKGYPSKPIRMVVPFTAGSATDILARMIGPKLHDAWGQQVVVDNRPSAGGTVAGGIVAAAVPDGHTLMLTSSVFAGAAALYPKLPYDTLKDFTGVTQIASTPLVLVTGSNSGVKSVKELIALAKEKPGQLNFGSSGIGAGPHYAGELFKYRVIVDG